MAEAHFPRHPPPPFIDPSDDPLGALAQQRTVAVPIIPTETPKAQTPVSVSAPARVEVPAEPVPPTTGFPRWLVVALAVLVLGAVGIGLILLIALVLALTLYK